MICSQKYCKKVLTEQDDINDKTKDYYKRCITCRNKGKCIHGFEKKNCKNCCNIPLCEHNKIQTTCSKCSNKLCEHNRFHNQCADCKRIKASNCIHDKITSECYLCNNKNECSHGIQKTKCLECGDGNCICNNCKNVFDQVDGETFKRCPTCRETVKKSVAKKLTTNTTETTNCCTTCYLQFDKIINTRTKKEYKTCNACREKDDERRQKKLEQAK
jgi:hypothetical protein